MGYLFFDILTNIEKFFQRSKDINDIDDNPNDNDANDLNQYCPWDKFIRREYAFLTH